LSRDDLRRQKRRQTNRGTGQRQKPFIFNFRPPDKSFKLSLSFRQSRISKNEVIQTLESILDGLRQSS